jgi:hypothetical protein
MKDEPVNNLRSEVSSSKALGKVGASWKKPATELQGVGEAELTCMVGRKLGGKENVETTGSDRYGLVLLSSCS